MLVHTPSKSASFVRWGTGIGLCVLTAFCHAQNCQQVDGTTQGTKEVLVSDSDLTSISVDGGRVRSIKYLQSSGYEIDKDPSTGQAFVVPPEKAKPVRVFVMSAAGLTHSLQLTPTKEPISCVVIHEPQKAEQPADKPLKPGVEALGMSPPDGAGTGSVAGDLRTAHTQLILDMARGSASGAYEVKTVRKLVPIWQEARFELLQRFVGFQGIGEHYRLTNISQAVMRLAEQEFYKPGVDAVAIELHELPPGASTDVFVTFVPTEAVQ